MKEKKEKPAQSLAEEIAQWMIANLRRNVGEQRKREAEKLKDEYNGMNGVCVR
jgi:hypothetical protein